MKDPYFRFTRVHGGVRVSVKLDGDANLSDLLDEFEAFLKGCGYDLPGALDFVGEVPEPEA